MNGLNVTKTVFTKAGFIGKIYKDGDAIDVREKLKHRIFNVCIIKRGAPFEGEVNVHAVMRTLIGEFVTDHQFINSQASEDEIIEWLKKIRVTAETIVNKEVVTIAELENIQLAYGEHVDKGLVNGR